jgi:hypothetical protein
LPLRRCAAAASPSSGREDTSLPSSAVNIPEERFTTTPSTAPSLSPSPCEKRRPNSLRQRSWRGGRPTAQVRHAAACGVRQGRGRAVGGGRRAVGGGRRETAECGGGLASRGGCGERWIRLGFRVHELIWAGLCGEIQKGRNFWSVRGKTGPTRETRFSCLSFFFAEKKTLSTAAPDLGEPPDNMQIRDRVGETWRHKM